MSYRAFKRLLGETSLERKCRFLFGAFILLLMTGSFWLYARQTEHLAYEQIRTNCRLLVTQIMDQQIATGCHEPTPDEVGRPEGESLGREPGAGARSAGRRQEAATEQEKKAKDLKE